MRLKTVRVETEISKPSSFNIFTKQNEPKILESGVHSSLWDFVSAVRPRAPAPSARRETEGTGSKNGVRTSTTEAVTPGSEGCTDQLARFFRGIAPVRIPVSVTASRAGSSQLQESVVVEFCGREHAIFRSGLPLEYNDDVRLAAHAIAGQLNARVVAVQYHEGLKAVAVRFQSGPCHWVTTT